MASKKDNYIGLQMGLNTDDLKAGITQAKKEISTARKEFNATTAGMDDWTKSVEGLNAKLSQLDKTINAQKRIVASYENEIQKATEAHGENSEQVRKLKDQLLDAQTALGKSEKSQRKYAKALQEVESESKETTTTTGKLTKAFKDADDASGRLGDGFTVLKGVMAGLITSGINAMVSGLQNIVQESREFRTEMAYLQATADTTGTSFDHVKENVKEVQSILGETDSAVEGMNNLMSAGFDGSALDAITDELVGASIKWHDTLRFEGLADGLQETLATGEAVGPFAELLERAGLDLETFNQGLAGATTQAEKQNYVLETLAGLGLTEVKEAFEETNQTLIDGSKAEWEYSEAMAQVGETAEPVLNAVKMGWANVLQAIFDTGNGMDTTNIAGKISEAFSWFIDTCVPFIQSALTWMIENFRTVATVVGLVGGAFLAWKVAQVLSDVVKGIRSVISVLTMMDLSVIKNTASWLANTASVVASTVAKGAQTVATTALTVAQGLLNTVTLAFPGTWLIAIIAAVIAIVVLMWKNWDKIIKWLGEAWEWLKQVAQQVWQAITGFFVGAWEAIKKAWSVVVEFFTGIWDGIVQAFSGVVTFFGDIFRKAWAKIQEAWSGVTTWFSDIVNKIVGFFKDLPSKLLQIGKDMMDGLINGVKEKIEDVKNAVKNAVNSAVEGVKDFLGISSPSKLLEVEVGQNMGLGIAEGLRDSTTDVVTSAGDLADNAIGSMDTETGVSSDPETAVPSTINYFQKIWNGIKGIFEPAPEYLRSVFNTAFQNVKVVWDGSDEYFDEVYQNIDTVLSPIPTMILSYFRTAFNNMKSVWNEADEFFNQVVSNMLSAFDGIYDKFYAIGKSARAGLQAGFGSGGLSVDGIADGVAGATSAVSGSGAGIGIATAGTTVVNNYTQTINAPKSPSRLEIYRQSKNLLNLKGVK